jgi:hypothetical protein
MMKSTFDSFVHLKENATVESKNGWVIVSSEHALFTMWTKDIVSVSTGVPDAVLTYGFLVLVLTRQHAVFVLQLDAKDAAIAVARFLSEQMIKSTKVTDTSRKLRRRGVELLEDEDEG